MAALGIDIEPAEPLPADLLDLVTTPRERAALQHDPFRGRLHFVVKEAVYKAVHPLDGIFLEHHDVELDFVRRTATTGGGRTIDFRYCVSSHLVALAYAPAA
jgi:4'-phosphopantetheinyl transferase EntD